MSAETRCSRVTTMTGLSWHLLHACLRSNLREMRVRLSKQLSGVRGGQGGVDDAAPGHAAKVAAAIINGMIASSRAGGRRAGGTQGGAQPTVEALQPEGAYVCERCMCAFLHDEHCSFPTKVVSAWVHHYCAASVCVTYRLLGCVQVLPSLQRMLQGRDPLRQVLMLPAAAVQRGSSSKPCSGSR